MEWQTIETAPKDDETILIWNKFVVIAATYHYTDDDGEVYWTDGGWSGTATHWLPAPPPPVNT